MGVCFKSVVGVGSFCFSISFSTNPPSSPILLLLLVFTSFLFLVTFLPHMLFISTPAGNPSFFLIQSPFVPTFLLFPSIYTFYILFFCSSRSPFLIHYLFVLFSLISLVPLSFHIFLLLLFPLLILLLSHSVPFRSHLPSPFSPFFLPHTPHTYSLPNPPPPFPSTSLFVSPQSSPVTPSTSSFSPLSCI